MDTSFVVSIHRQETQQDGGQLSQLQAGPNWERGAPSLKEMGMSVPYQPNSLFLDISFSQSLDAHRKQVS